MPLAPGTRLGPYDVTAQIGVGGMGEVYRGRDGTLNRDVAIKVLPAALASDTERLARFKREARSMSVNVTLGAACAASAPRLVHEGRFLKSQNDLTGWSITPDGSRFLRIQQVEPERAVTRIDLVLNWFEEVKAKVNPR